MTQVPTLRISGGEHRGRKIHLPRRHELRPTSDKARQAFFNIVGPRLLNARFLDLFAGSGIFSFEALSRGARSATVVEKNPHAAAAIREEAGRIGLPLGVIEADVFATLKRLASGDDRFDLVYADPPYDFPRYDELLAALDRDAPLATDAVVAIEHQSSRSPFRRTAGRLRYRRTATYGTVAISLFDLAEPETGGVETNSSDQEKLDGDAE